MLQLYRTNFWHLAYDEGGGGQHDKSLEKVNMCDYPQETILNFYKGKHEEFRRFGGVNKHLFRKIDSITNLKIL